MKKIEHNGRKTLRNKAEEEEEEEEEGEGEEDEQANHMFVRDVRRFMFTYS